MARFRRKEHGFGARIRHGEGLDEWFHIEVEHEAELVAKDRHRRLQRMANLMRASGRHVESRVILEEAGAERGEKAFRALEVMVEGFAPEQAKAEPAGPRTFNDVARLWLSNELHGLYPRQIRKKTASIDARYRGIAAHFANGLGRKPVTEITAKDAEDAMGTVPAGLAPGTRRHYEFLVRRVMALAVWPLRLLEHNPIPQKFVGPQGKSPAFAYLYPAEESALLNARAVTLDDRILYGVLAREGFRLSEALRLAYGDIDFVRGTVALDRNKTNAPRSWQLDPGTLAALKRYRGQAVDDDLVFPMFTARDAAGRFREHLRAALEEAGLPLRPALFRRTSERRPIRVHDLRGTFITLALAAGRTETWVMDRTGHTTSAMLNRYRRVARTAAETERGWLEPLDQALRWGLGQSVGQTAPGQPEKAPATSTGSASSAEPGASVEPNQAGSDRATLPYDARGPREKLDQGQAGPTDSPVEQALAAALQVAIGAQQWQLAQTIVQELGERRRASTAPAPGVSSIADARKKRDEGGK